MDRRIRRHSEHGFFATQEGQMHAHGASFTLRERLELDIMSRLSSRGEASEAKRTFAGIPKHKCYVEVCFTYAKILCWSRAFMTLVASSLWTFTFARSLATCVYDLRAKWKCCAGAAQNSPIAQNQRILEQGTCDQCIILSN